MFFGVQVINTARGDRIMYVALLIFIIFLIITPVTVQKLVHTENKLVQPLRS